MNTFTVTPKLRKFERLLWITLGLTAILACISCSSQDGSRNERDIVPTAPLPTPTFESEPRTPFSVHISYYNTPAPCALADMLGGKCEIGLLSEPVIEPEVVRTPLPVTREYLEGAINRMVGGIAHEFDRIHYPDYETFALDIPSAPLRLTRCSSGMLDGSVLTMLCMADNKNPTGVYSSMLVTMNVGVGNGIGDGGIFFFIVGEPLDWASVQLCTMTYRRYYPDMQSSLSCSEPKIGSVDAVMAYGRDVIDAWHDQ